MKSFSPQTLDGWDPVAFTSALKELKASVEPAMFFHEKQGCQMADFRIKNAIVGNFGRSLLRKTLVYFMAICSTYVTASWFILWPFVIL
jgi:hypothetical protein